MAQPESKLSRKIQNHLKETFPGLFIFKVWGNPQMMAGLPDLIGCWRGKFFGLEVKMPGEAHRVKPRQLYVIEMIRYAGGIAEVVTSPEEAEIVIRHIS